MGNNISNFGGTDSLSVGSETELIKIEGARLYLVDEEESMLLQSGKFVLKLTKQARSSLATVDAEVADVHWPAAKDSLVCKIRERWYTFSIPGVFYALIFTEAASLEDLQELESLLLEYSLFEIRSDVSIVGLEAAYKRDCAKESDFIRGGCPVANSAEFTSAKVARRLISKRSTIFTEGISRSSEWAASSIQKASLHVNRRTSGTEGAEVVEISPQMKARVQRARRVSAVTKLISKALLKGAISASNHAGSTLSGRISSSSSGKAFREWRMDGVSLSSVDACSKVVDAVELCGRNVLKATGRAGSDLVQRRYGNEAGVLAREGFGALGNVVNTLWTPNTIGLGMLSKATAASTVINVARQNHAAIESSSAVLHGDYMLPPSSDRSRKADQLYSCQRKYS